MGGEHAVVIGGSVAGLLAARALAGHYGRVTVVERDRLPDGPLPRSGAPQARQVHIMLLRGHSVIERLFPGFTAALAADGAVPLDLMGDSAVLTINGWLPQAPSSLRIHSCSRDLIEHHLRRRVAALPGVSFLDGREVLGLLATPGGQVRGVLLRRRGAAPAIAPLEELAADLVADASGRGSKAPDWLAGLGYGQAPETVVNAHLGYASRWYHLPAGWPAPWKMRLVRSRPPLGTRGGLIYPVEGDRWTVNLGGSAGDYPPTDEAGFMAFARSLPDPGFAAALESAEPISPIYGYRRTENRWRHFEELPRWPQGFVAMGDAVCGFNPAYGQGMTVAAIGAEVLGACLRSGGPAMARRFQRRLAAELRLPWLMATGEDFRLPTTEGVRPGAAARPVQRYLDLVATAAVSDPGLAEAFYRVVHLVAPPSTLLRPRVMAGALRAAAWWAGARWGRVAAEPQYAQSK
ncbi:MAG: 2-polyprenyl-6-methoxyphenol hydroxylase-like oxidoreductase [Chloroflexales bacterium]|nr:2-polyprenyl-6-methoxyphenol hydroxylase-like oxidoreductase [Chloroflexales bacterium]